MPPVIDHPAEGVSAAISPLLTLQVNGEPRSCPPGLQLQQALEALGYRPQLVVVEGDVLEVVTIVGGGS